MPRRGQDAGGGPQSGYTDRCSHRQERGNGGWLPTEETPGGSLGQGLEDGIHLLRHSCQGKFKLVLGREGKRTVMGRPGFCSGPNGNCLWGRGAGDATGKREKSFWGRYRGRQERQAAAGFPGQGWHQGLGQRGTVTLERTRPGRWSRTCSRVAAMSISFTPGGRRHGAAQWMSRGG